MADLAASFQAAVVDVLVGKILAAADAVRRDQILVAGGVSANSMPCAKTIQERSPVPVRLPPLSLCTDNAAMIAAAGHRRYQAGQRDALDIDALPGWPLAG